MPCLQIPLFKLPNLLPHLPLPVSPDYLWAPQVPLIWAAGCHGCLPMGLALLVWWFQHSRDGLFQHLVILVILLWGWLHQFGGSNIFRLWRFQCLVALITHGHCGTHLWSNSLYSVPGWFPGTSLVGDGHF